MWKKGRMFKVQSITYSTTCVDFAACPATERRCTSHAAARTRATTGDRCAMSKCGEASLGYLGSQFQTGQQAHLWTASTLFIRLLSSIEYM